MELIQEPDSVYSNSRNPNHALTICGVLIGTTQNINAHFVGRLYIGPLQSAF